VFYVKSFYDWQIYNMASKKNKKTIEEIIVEGLNNGINYK